MTRPLVLRDWLVAGGASGLVAGVLVTAFAAFAATHSGLPATAPFSFIASAVGGPTFGDGPEAAPVGVLLLLLASILWAFGYIYGATKQAQLLTRPFISGAGYGVVVWLFTQAMLVGAGKYTAPNIYTFDRDMVAYIIFFGIPMAFVASRLLRTR